MGSAIFALGLGLGVGVAVTVQTWIGEGAVAVATSKDISPASLQRERLQAQIDQLILAEGPANAETALPPAKSVASQQSRLAGAPQELPKWNAQASPLLNEMLLESSHDPEQDRYYLAQAQAKFDRGELAAAMRQWAKVSQARLRAELGATWTDEIHRQGYTTQAEALYAYLARSFTRLPPGSAEAIEGLALLARRQAAIGNPAMAQDGLATIQKLAMNLDSSCDRAIAAAELAATRAALAHAPADFRKAQVALGQIVDGSEYDQCNARLARIFALAGERAAAYRLLQDSLSSVPSIESAALLFAEWGDAAQALGLASKLTDTYRRERLLHHILAQGFLATQPEATTTILKSLSQPVWLARAFGLQAAAHVQGAMDSARQAVEKITQTAEKVAVLSELSRFAEHSGDHASAEKLSQQAQALAATLKDDPANHDAAMAVLAFNLTFRLSQ